MATRDSLVRWLVDQSVVHRDGPRNARRRASHRGTADDRHKDVEFAVDDNRGEEHIFKTFEEAIAFAGRIALTTTVRIDLDVLVYSREGAKWWSGIDGAQDYDEDPEASVFDRLHVKVTSQGRVA